MTLSFQEERRRIIEVELKRCFEVLEIRPGCTLEEVKQAYRDAVAVWHPDRFSGNPRLKAKAETKLKEINTAYETLLAHWPEANSQAKKEDPSLGINAEAMAETATKAVLRAYQFLHNSIKKLKDHQ